MSRQGFLRTLFQNVRSSLSQLKGKKNLVGNDELGNKYYEITADTARRIKGSRWVEPLDKDPTLYPEVPPAWEAWLRNKNRPPPTDEMIMKNKAILQRTLQRAKEIEQREKLESSENEGSGLTTSLPNKKEHTNAPDFPNFKEYEMAPGKSRNDTNK